MQEAALVGGLFSFRSHVKAEVAPRMNDVRLWVKRETSITSDLRLAAIGTFETCRDLQPTGNDDKTLAKRAFLYAIRLALKASAPMPRG
jgi:hypothetical protein